MKRFTFTLALLLLTLIAVPTPARQQAALERERSEFAALIREQQKATQEYVASLKDLLALYEQNFKRAQDRADKSRQLYEENLIGRRALDDDLQAVPVAQAQIEKVKTQLKDAEIELADVMAQDPEAVAHQLIKQPRKRERTPQGRVYYVRFVIVGEMEIYDYSGSIRGRVVKRRGQIKYDSRKQ